MLDMPDNVATKHLLSGFADDKFNNRLQTLKNRHSLRVTEEEEESSGMAGIPKTMLFLSKVFSFDLDDMFYSVHEVLLLLFSSWICPLCIRFITVETFPIWAAESDRSQLCSGVTQQFIPACVKGPSPESKSVGLSGALCPPTVIFTMTP